MLLSPEDIVKTLFKINKFEKKGFFLEIERCSVQYLTAQLAQIRTWPRRGCFAMNFFKHPFCGKPVISYYVFYYWYDFQ